MEGKRHHTIIYQRKENTQSSYYLMEGSNNLLPGRISITAKQITPTSKQIKTPPCGELNAKFRKLEQSKYRSAKATIHSRIYPAKGYSKLIGTGDIEGHDDLLIFEDISCGGWKKIAIHIFEGSKFRPQEILESFK